MALRWEEPRCLRMMVMMVHGMPLPLLLLFGDLSRQLRIQFLLGNTFISRTLYPVAFLVPAHNLISSWLAHDLLTFSL